MKLIKPSVEEWHCGYTLPEIWSHIAKCARVCYQSEPRNNNETDEEFVKRVILRNHSFDEIAENRDLQLKLHLSVLEHGTIYLKLPKVNYVAEFYKAEPHSKIYIGYIESNKPSVYITTNIRVMVEHGRINDSQYICTPTKYHYLRTTFNITTDIGVARELARHRTHSISEESTRYCVSGNTYLSFKNIHNKYTIKELYENKKHLSQILIKYLNEDTGTFEYAKPKNIFYNGKKQTYKVVTKLGYELTCTKEHQIYTPGGYKKLGELSIGDKIYVNGITTEHLYQNKDWLYNQYITLDKTITDIDKQFGYKEDVLRKWLHKFKISKPKDNNTPLYQNRDWLYEQNITLNKTFVQIAKEFGFNLSTIKKWAKKLNLPQKGTGYFNKGRIPWNKGLDESDDKVKIQANALRKYHYDNSKKGIKIMKDDTKKYQKHNSGICNICGATTENLEIHHIDQNRDNNKPSNLITLCESCHQRIHSHNLLSIYADTIIDIKEVAVEDVYDIEMSTYHNYIANGIVVHNCNYSKDKFNNELTFIIPEWIDIPKGSIDLGNYDKTSARYKDGNVHIIDTKPPYVGVDFIRSLCEAEYNYLSIVRNGWTPQQARQVLPLSTKVQTIHTAFNYDWDEFVKLRANACSGSVHPNMKVIANKIKNLMSKENAAN